MLAVGCWFVLDSPLGVTAFVHPSSTAPTFPIHRRNAVINVFYRRHPRRHYRHIMVVDGMRCSTYLVDIYSPTSPSIRLNMWWLFKPGLPTSYLAWAFYTQNIAR